MRRAATVTSKLSLIKVAIFLFLGIAFVPTAILVSRLLFLRMRPPKDRPFAFLVFGAFFIAVGLTLVAVAFYGLYSGVVDCAFKNCSGRFEVSGQPAKYWASTFSRLCRHCPASAARGR